MHKLTSKMLIWAIRAEQTKVINAAAICRVNFNKKDKYQRSLVHIAALTGNLKLMTALLRNGADPNICDRFGETPLHFAAKWGDMNLTSILLANNADPNYTAPNSSPKTPFWTAVEYQQEQVIAEMLRGGRINLNYVNWRGVSLIDYVITQKNPKITAMLEKYARREVFKALYIGRLYDEKSVVFADYLCDDLFKLILNSVVF